MLSYRTQNRLASLIQNVAEGEKKTEVVRQVLAEQSLFEPYTAFRRIDQLRNGYLSTSDLVDFLADSNVAITIREAYHLFKRFDANHDGRITYTE